MDNMQEKSIMMKERAITWRYAFSYTLLVLTIFTSSFIFYGIIIYPEGGVKHPVGAVFLALVIFGGGVSLSLSVRPKKVVISKKGISALGMGVMKKHGNLIAYDQIKAALIDSQKNFSDIVLIYEANKILQGRVYAGIREENNSYIISYLLKNDIPIYKLRCDECGHRDYTLKNPEICPKCQAKRAPIGKEYLKERNGGPIRR